ncbi:MAG: GntR family transcriptional regulator [Gammaproteobacteria bacterium]|nr:MAG: GntR family transcriptional regulator [Gammaproteobacteria bacterium]
MQLNIIPSSGIPIYKQVYEQIERMIVNNHLSTGLLLPSVRQVALELEVNPMTISKAYGLLEERGFLMRQRGKGMLIAERDQQVSEQEKLTVLTNKIDKLVIEAQQMGIGVPVLTRLFTQQLQQKKMHQVAIKSSSKSDKE